MKARLLNKDKLFLYLEKRYGIELEALEQLLRAEYQAYPSQDRYVIKIPEYHLETQIQFKKSEVHFKSCNCAWFLKAKHCVHLYWLMRHIKDSINSNQSESILKVSNKKKSDREHQLAILINNISSEELNTFLLEIAMKDKNIALQLNNKFATTLTDTDNSDAIRQHILDLIMLISNPKSSDVNQVVFNKLIQEYVFHIRIARLNKHFLSGFLLSKPLLNILIKVLYNKPLEQQPQEILEIIEAEIVLLAEDELSPDLKANLREEIIEVLLSSWYLPFGARTNFYHLPSYYLPDASTLKAFLFDRMFTIQNRQTSPFELYNAYYFGARLDAPDPDWSMEQWSSMVSYSADFSDEIKTYEALAKAFVDKIPVEIADTALELLLSKQPNSIRLPEVMDIFINTWFHFQTEFLLRFIPDSLKNTLSEHFINTAKSFAHRKAAAHFCKLTGSQEVLEQHIKWNDYEFIFAFLPACSIAYILEKESHIKDAVFKFTNDHIGRKNAEMLVDFLLLIAAAGLNKQVASWTRELNKKYGDRPTLGNELLRIQKK